MFSLHGYNGIFFSFYLSSFFKTSAFVFDSISRNTSCYKLYDEFYPLTKADDNLKVSEKAIFFLETSCKGCLNSRQACSVESAATANPDWEIYVLLTGPISEKCQLGQLFPFLTSKENVKFVRINVTEFVKGSHVEVLFTRNVFVLSPFPVVHNADILRLVTLNKYGGMYLDLDVIVMRSFNDLPKNFFTKQSKEYLTSGIFRFANTGMGKIVSDLALQDLRVNFRPWLWRHNGPDVFHRILKRICSTTDILKWSAVTCQGVEVFNARYFFPVHWYSWDLYYREYPLEKLNDSFAYTHHIWNQQGGQREIKPKSVYKSLAKKYCPNIVKLSRSRFGMDRGNEKEKPLVMSLP